VHADSTASIYGQQSASWPFAPLTGLLSAVKSEVTCKYVIQLLFFPVVYYMRGVSRGLGSEPPAAEGHCRLGVWGQSPSAGRFLQYYSI